MATQWGTSFLGQRGGRDFTGKEQVTTTAATFAQEIGISISIRIGMPLLAAFFAVTEFIWRHEKW